MNPTLTRAECEALAEQGITAATAHIEACERADARLAARQAVDSARSQLNAGAVRPSLMWSCKAAAIVYGYDSAEFAAAQKLYDVVYASHCGN